VGGCDNPIVAQPALLRRLGTADAVVVGLGAMLGAGVFAVFGPAAQAADAGLLAALGIAAVVAYLNARSSAALAATYPESGGSYVYGRRRLGPIWGFLAGWGFIIGKTASCAAMALTFGAYVWPDQSWLPAAVAVTALTAVNFFGVTKTLALTRVLVVLTLVALTVAVVAALASGTTTASNVTDWSGVSALGVLQAAGLLFFAFAGYARIATLGEEVRDPQRTIPRAIPLALGVVVVVYAVVGTVVLAALGPDVLAGSAAPLADAAAETWAEVLVRIGAAVASVGVLLSLMAGIGRTTLAMARDGELPRVLAAVHPRFRVPHRAELLLGAVVLAVVLVFDLRGAIAFSSFAVLVYYGVANASAYTLPGHSRAPAALGLLGCAVLAFTLPVAAVVTGCALLAVGLLGRSVLARRRT